ncbi:MAG: arginine N-succinyltransferase [Myxococcota bacterium]
MFRLRPAGPGDLDALLELARLLDSPNLPASRPALERRLERSERSFARPGRPSPEREFQFALVAEDDQLVGTSAILSKHGTADMPHIFLRVGHDERFTHAAGIHMRHTTFQLGVCRDGPSELGALILHPDLRGQPGWPGKLLSWGRFTYIARDPDSFEDGLLAEMRASLDPQGRSAFWEAFGRHFTGMTYAEADRRSATRKQFILDLFPRSVFYATLLPGEVARELGQVHPEARPAVRLLEQAGLTWIGEIDPFDAGPFFGASRRAILPIRETRERRVAGGEPSEGAEGWILSCGAREGFRALAARAEALDAHEVRIEATARKALGVEAGEPIFTTPLPRPTRPPERRAGDAS